MPITFDGPNKLLILSSGTTTLDVRDAYSRWKDWAQSNAQYLEAFSPVGGDPIDPGAGTSVPLYAFLANGWRVRPQEAGHTLNVTGGVLLVSGGGDPFVDTLGSFVVRVNYQQPVQAITVSTGGGGGLSTAQADQLRELHEIHGLDAAKPLAVTPISREAGSIAQSVSESSGNVTVTRTA